MAKNQVSMNLDTLTEPQKIRLNKIQGKIDSNKAELSKWQEALGIEVDNDMRKISVLTGNIVEAMAERQAHLVEKRAEIESSIVSEQSSTSSEFASSLAGDVDIETSEQAMKGKKLTRVSGKKYLLLPTNIDVESSGHSKVLDNLWGQLSSYTHKLGEDKYEGFASNVSAWSDFLHGKDLRKGLNNQAGIKELMDTYSFLPEDTDPSLVKEGKEVPAVILCSNEEDKIVVAIHPFLIPAVTKSIKKALLTDKSVSGKHNTEETTATDLPDKLSDRVEEVEDQIEIPADLDGSDEDDIDSVIEAGDMTLDEALTIPDDDN